MAQEICGFILLHGVVAGLELRTTVRQRRRMGRMRFRAVGEPDRAVITGVGGVVYVHNLHVDTAVGGGSERTSHGMRC